MITAKLVSELREATGAGMMDCKKALTETDGDMEKAIFSEPFGGGYPKSEAKRKIADANQLKVMRAKSQISFESFLNELDDELITKVRCLMERTKH